MVLETTELTKHGKARKHEINEKLFSRLYEWRLNLETKTVSGEYLTGTKWSLEFPMIHNNYTGVRHNYAYAQIVDSLRSGGASKRGMAKTHFYNTNSMKVECIFFLSLHCYASRFD
jgi:carotenoid cleavage dioxygenase-like enzyme